MFHPSLEAFDRAHRHERPERRGQLVPVAEKRAAEHRDHELLCVDCAHPITRESARIEHGGAHAHTFVNPAGIRFCIGCFTDAPGVRTVGEETDELTWFPGFAWTIAVCGGCGGLAGWRYRGPDRDTFYGLILDRLREGEWGLPPGRVS